MEEPGEGEEIRDQPGTQRNKGTLIWSTTDVPGGWWKDSIQFLQCLGKTDVIIQLADKEKAF